MSALQLVDCEPYRARMDLASCLARRERSGNPQPWENIRSGRERKTRSLVDTDECRTCLAGARRAAGEPEPDSCKETTMDPAQTTDTTPSSPASTLCPCGCGREVASGRTYASKGCAGRMRWRGVGHPKERAGETEPAAAEEPPALVPPVNYGAPIPVIADVCPRCNEARQRPGDGSSRHPHWTCPHCGHAHDIPMGPQGVEWMPVAVQQQLATVREETARRYEQEAAALTERLERAEAELPVLHDRLLREEEEMRHRALTIEGLGEENVRMVRQLGEIDKALGKTCQLGHRELPEILTCIEELQEGQDRTQKFIVDEATKALRERVAELEQAERERDEARAVADKAALEIESARSYLLSKLPHGDEGARRLPLTSLVEHSIQVRCAAAQPWNSQPQWTAAKDCPLGLALQIVDLIGDR